MKIRRLLVREPAVDEVSAETPSYLIRAPLRYASLAHKERSDVTIEKMNRSPLMLIRLWQKASAEGATYGASRFGAPSALIMENRDRRGDEERIPALLLAGIGEWESAR